MARIAGTRTRGRLSPYIRLHSLVDRDQGFNLAKGEKDTIFKVIERDPARLQRLKEAMLFFASNPDMSTHLVMKGFDWSAYDGATFVDIGGSHGLVGFEIARALPSFHVVIQDLPEVIAEVRDSVPEELSERVTFMAHDFFQEQPAKDAQFYFFRLTMHNWSDKYAVKILQSLIPALNPGDWVLVNEVCLPRHGTASAWSERLLRYV